MEGSGEDRAETGSGEEKPQMHQCGGRADERGQVTGQCVPRGKYQHLRTNILN